MTLMKKIKSNNGFTLIELVIALAMLAFIMTAVSAMMGNSIMTFRKSKADISVQNEAQSAYERVSDAIMQAKRVVIHGYISTDANMDEFKNEKNGTNVSGNFQECYLVADIDTKKELVNKEGVAEGSIKLFSELDPKAVVFVKDMTIDNAVAIDQPDRIKNFSSSVMSANVENVFTGQTVELKKLSDSPLVYNINDTQRNIFTFSQKNMYLERKYALQCGQNTAADSGKNDVVDDWSDYDSRKLCLYTDSLKYMTNGTEDSQKEIPGCVLKVDRENGAIEVTIYFDDKNISYVTEGVVKVRNTGVLENK